MEVYRERLSTQKKAEGETSPSATLNHGKLLIICANEDTSTVNSDLVADVTGVFEGNVHFQYLDAGHDVPISKSREVVAANWESWTAWLYSHPANIEHEIGSETIRHSMRRIHLWCHRRRSKVDRG